MTTRTAFIASLAFAWLGCRAPAVGAGAAAGAASPEGAKIAAAVQAAVDAKQHKVVPHKRLDGTTVDVVTIDALRFHISASCLQRDGKLACKAFEGLRAIPSKHVVPGHGNPAGYYCEPVGAVNVTLVSPAGQAGFCAFSDGSLISDWTLVYTPGIVLAPKGH